MTFVIVLGSEASPLTHVTPDSAPFLLVPKTGDPIVSRQQLEIMNSGLKKAGVTRSASWRGDARNWRWSACSFSLVLTPASREDQGRNNE